MTTHAASSSHWTAWARRHLLGLLLAIAATLGAATVAVAFWTIGLHPNPQGSANGAQLSAPTTPTATVNGSEAITVGWTLPGAQLPGAAYKVTRTSGPGSPTTVCTVTTTSCQDTGLTPATAYGYSVIAVLGTSWQSSAITTSATTSTPVFTITLSAGPYTAGTPITVQTITAKVAGVTDTTYTGAKTITWSGLASSPAPSSTAPVYPSSSVTFTNGVASPGTTVTAYKAGSNSLIATDAAASAVTGTVTFTVNAVPTNDTMSTVQGNNQSASVGVGFATPLEVSVLDQYSNPVPSVSVTFTAPASGASGTFTASSTNTTSVSTTAGGTATASTFTANHVAGGYNVTTSASGVASPATFSETNNASTATTIAISSGGGQSATVGAAFAAPLVALVTDTYGNPVSGATVTFTAPASGAGGTFLAATNGGACLATGGSAQKSCAASTNASGQASTLTFTANTTAGAYNVTATSPGTTPNPLNFSETNNPGTATKLTFTAQPSTNANIQATGTGSFAASVAVEDANGNIETGDNATTVTLAIGTNPSSGVLTCTNTGGLGPVTVSGGVASFTGCAITKTGTGYTLTASSSPAHTAPANANSFNITAGSATQLAFTVQPSTNANIQATGTGTFAASVAVQDTNGNTETGDTTTTVTLAIGTNPSSGVLTCTNTGGLGPVTVSSGVASFTGCAITKSGNGYTLTATSSPSRTAPSNANSFNITAGSATKLTFTTQPGSGQNLQATGTGSFSVTVGEQDTNGNAVTNDSSTTVTLAIGTNPSSGVLTCTNTGGLGPVTMSSGVASFTGCAITKTGNGYTLSASSNPAHTAPANANSFNITAGTATQLGFTAQPSSGQNIQATGTGTFTASVAVQDTDGNTVTSDSTTTVTLAIGTNPSSGVLTCTNTGGLGPVTVSSGVASFTGCAITKGGTGYTLTATSSPSQTAPANANSFNITAGTPTKLTFTTQPSSGQNIQATGTGSFAVTVAEQDTNGNTVTSDNSTTVTLSIASNPSSGVLTCTNTGGLTVTESSGLASFSGCAITKAGTGYTLTATSSPSHAVPANANGFNITAGSAASIAAVSGGGQSATVGAAFTNPLVALVTDSNGNPVSAASVTFAGPSSGASGTFAACSSNPQTYSCVATTGSNGQATSSTFTANTTAGTYNIAATSAGTTPTPLNFSATNIPGTATKLSFTTQPTLGQNIQATGTGTFAVSVAVQDANGNTETADNGTTVTLAIGTNPSSGVLTCTNTGGLGPVTVSSGVASFTGCAITKAGNGYTLNASSNPSRTAPSNANSFNITAGTFTQYAVGLASGGVTGTAVSVTLTAQDVNGNQVTSYAASNQSITWTGPTSSPNGTLPTLPAASVSFSGGVNTTTLQVTFTKAGSQTLTATDGSARTGSGTTTVAAGPDGLSFSVSCSSFDARKTKGTSITIKRGTDQFGNVVTDANAGSSVQVTLSGANGTWSPTGPLTLVGGVTTTPSETWTNGASSGVTASPTASAPGYASVSCSYTTTN